MKLPKGAILRDADTSASNFECRSERAKSGQGGSEGGAEDYEQQGGEQAGREKQKRTPETVLLRYKNRIEGVADVIGGMAVNSVRLSNHHAETTIKRPEPKQQRDKKCGLAREGHCRGNIVGEAEDAEINGLEEGKGGHNGLGCAEDGGGGAFEELFALPEPKEVVWFGWAAIINDLVFACHILSLSPKKVLLNTEGLDSRFRGNDRHHSRYTANVPSFNPKSNNYRYLLIISLVITT
jgi:hypothetical protein